MHAPNLPSVTGISDALASRDDAVLQLPSCGIHPGSLIRRYRTHGPNGPGVYPQCVPEGDDRPHLLSWPGALRSSPTRNDTTTLLSPSEYRVLEDASNGMTVIETATNRSKSPETVKSQRRSILLKLGARNMAQAVGMMGQISEPTGMLAPNERVGY